MKKWVITIAAGLAFVAVGFTAGWWVPQLKAFLEGNHEAVTQLNHLTGLVWRIVGSAAAVVFFIYRLWHGNRKEDGAKAGRTDAVENIHAGRDANVAGGNIQTGGVSISGGHTEIHGDVVGGDQYVTEAPVPAIPALHQLKAPPGDFTGREDELNELRAAIGSGGATISGLTGQGGVGKTVLALKLADEIKTQFPDAQIYLDLLGVSEPKTPSQAMAHVIGSFEPKAKLPEEENALAATYRSVLDGKRALLLMDNAKDAAQVMPLIPPKGCFFLVTSRLHFALPGLRAKDLNTLPPAKSEELLLKIAPRIGAEAPAIAKLCGYLPQALRLAGTALAERVNLAPLDYRQRLADEQNRPKLLAVGNDSVAASISLSYGLLDAETQKRWRMLGVFPETFDGAAAAAVWSAEKNSAEDTLGVLTQYSMLEWNEKARRYRLHDLTRDFARQELAVEERYEVSLRHAQNYLEVLRNADGLFKKGGDSLMTGLALFDLERGNVEAGQAWAKENAATDRTAAEICNSYPDAGVYCLELRHDPRERIHWLQAGLAAARRLEDRGAEAVHLGNLGVAYRNSGEYRRAIEYYEQQLQIVRDIGDRRGEGHALGNLGNAYVLLGQYCRGVEYHEQALLIAREIGDRRGEGQELGNLAAAYRNLGEYHRSIEYLEWRLQIAREIGDRPGEANALGGLGTVYGSLGENRRCIEYNEQRLQIAGELGDRRGEGFALGSLGISYKRLGERRRAVECYEQQLLIAHGTGDRYSECTALWNMSLALEDLGDRKEAIKLAEASLKIHEEIEDPFAPKIRKQLEEWRNS